MKLLLSFAAFCCIAV